MPCCSIRSSGVRASSSSAASVSHVRVGKAVSSSGVVVLRLGHRAETGHGRTAQPALLVEVSFAHVSHPAVDSRSRVVAGPGYARSPTGISTPTVLPGCASGQAHAGS